MSSYDSTYLYYAAALLAWYCFWMNWPLNITYMHTVCCSMCVFTMLLHCVSNDVIITSANEAVLPV